jgi:hypothetical protein
MSHPDPYWDHLQTVQAVAAAGVEPPAEWVALRDRFDALFPDNPTFGLRDRLARAVINPQPDDDLPLLKAAVTAEGLGNNQAFGHIRAAVLDELRRIYSTVAQQNYQAIAKQFDQAAKRFADAAALADPEGDPASMISQPDKSRKAYLDSESHANQLTRLIPALCGAATLATGIDVHPANQQLVLPLCVDVSTGKRRSLWDGWDTTSGRTGRWGALAKLCATIRAHPLTEPLTEYRRALPVEQRRRQAPGQPHGILEYYTFDPESDVEQIDPFHEQPGRMRAV